MKVYNSEVKVLRLKDIPENGDLMFSLANPSYHSILVDSQVQIDYEGISPEVSHTPREKAAIGVDNDGMTMLVEVEAPGVTVGQLANIMVLLDCKYAVYTDIAVIKTYELLELEAAQSDKSKKFRPLPSQSAKPKDLEVEFVAEDKPESRKSK